jgi:hypothetical protein
LNIFLASANPRHVKFSPHVHVGYTIVWGITSCHACRYSKQWRRTRDSQSQARASPHRVWFWTTKSKIIKCQVYSRHSSTKRD